MRRDGLSIPPWSGRRKVEATAWMRKVGRAKNLPCCLCGQPIDYDLSPNDQNGCTVQHVKSRKYFPELTWDRSNWSPCHRGCNLSAGADGAPGLGVVSVSI